MDLCKKNNIHEYFDSISVYQYENEYDESIDLNEEIIIDDYKPYTFMLIGKHHARF